MYASQQYHPVLPFNMNYPKERIGWQVNRSMMKEAVEEVLGPRLDNLTKFVGSNKSGSGAGPTVSSGGDQSGNVTTVLAEVQAALDALNEAREKQGNTLQEMEDLQAKLEELEAAKKALERQRTVNEATLVAMLRVTQVVGGVVDREAGDKDTFQNLRKENLPFMEAIDAFMKELSEVREQLNATKTEYDTLRNTTDQSGEAAAKGLRDKIKDLEREKGGLEHKVTQAGNSLWEALNKAKGDFDAQLKAKNTELDAEKQKLEGLDEGETVASLKGVVEAARKELGALETAKSELDTKLEGLTKGAEDYAELKTKYDDLIVKKGELVAQVLKLQAKITGTKNPETSESPTTSPRPSTGTRVPQTPDKDNVSSGAEEFYSGDGGSSGSRSWTSSPRSSRAGSDTGVGEEEGGTEPPASEAESGGEGAEEEGKSTGELEYKKLGIGKIRDIFKQVKVPKSKKDGTPDRDKQANEETFAAALGGSGNVFVDGKKVDFADTNMEEILPRMKAILGERERTLAAGNFINKHGLNKKDGTVIIQPGFASFDLGKLFMWL